MNSRPEMSWTCPDCQSRNASIITSDTEAGEVVDVRCRDCGTDHQAAVHHALTVAGALMTVGVVWV